MVTRFGVPGLNAAGRGSRILADAQNPVQVKDDIEPPSVCSGRRGGDPVANVSGTQIWYLVIAVDRRLQTTTRDF